MPSCTDLRYVWPRRLVLQALRRVGTSMKLSQPFRALLRPWAVAVALACSSMAAAADIWVFDKDHTEIRFTWDHLGLSRQSGRFLEMRGELDFTPTDPERGQITVVIRMASLSTGVAALDTHLKSADFFDAARFPEATFKSTAVRRTGDRKGEVDGILELRGLAKPVTLVVTWNFTGEYPLASINPRYQGKWVSGFSATTTIRRSEWGISRAIPLIPDEIVIAIETELLRKEE